MSSRFDYQEDQLYIGLDGKVELAIPDGLSPAEAASAALSPGITERHCSQCGAPETKWLAAINAAAEQTDGEASCDRVPQPAPPAAPPDDEAVAMDKGPWTVRVLPEGKQPSSERVLICSDDFTHDVTLKFTGDFVDFAQRQQYAESLAATLNSNLRPAPPDMALGAGVLADATERMEALLLNGNAPDAAYELWDYVIKPALRKGAKP